MLFWIMIGVVVIVLAYGIIANRVHKSRWEKADGYLEQRKYSSSNYFFEDKKGSLSKSVAIAFGLFVSFCITCAIVHCNTDTVIKDNGITYIYSIKNTGPMVSGRFSLGCGTINSRLVYVAYRKNGAGYSLIRISSGARIIETDEHKPHLHWFKGTKTHDWLVPWNSVYTGYAPEIYVPKGTIIQEFKL